MKRSTCIICRKKRYVKNLRIQYLLLIETYYTKISQKYVCSSGQCYFDFKNKLSSQVRQIERIKSLNDIKYRA